MTRLWPLTLRGTGALVLALLCFVLAGRLGLSELVYFGLLLIGALGAALASLYATRRADAVSRSLSTEVATVDRRSTVTVRVGIRAVLPSPPGRWTDTLPRTLTGTASGVFPAVGSGLRGDQRVVSLAYDVTGARRGVQPIGPFRITSTDPFGLARRRHVVGERTTVTVVPPVVELAAVPGSAGETGGALHTTTDQLGQGADNLIARPYMPGDSMRRIHWRATAHRDTLMVRQEEQESMPSATVILDRSAMRWSPEATRAPGTDPAFETAVSMCVSVAARLAREGCTVDVVDADGTALVDPLDGDDLGGIEAMLSSIAPLVAARDDRLGRATALFAGVSTGPIVLIVGRFDEADAATVAPIAHHSSLPVLFAASPVGDALERAIEAGWHSCAIGGGADLAAAWHSVTERGVGSVLR